MAQCGAGIERFKNFTRSTMPNLAGLGAPTKSRNILSSAVGNFSGGGKFLGNISRRFHRRLYSNMPNQLAKEKSPYLLQHKDNPVQWHPWTESTLSMASKMNRPIFLSIGYSTCHWCHVMERESFENPEIAQVMNENFVNVKMDREERPDLDAIYMGFVVALTGHGGWPLSIWITPTDLKPFYGGTYFPPNNRYFGRPGFRSILETISEQWKEDEGKVRLQADKIFQLLRKGQVTSATGKVVDVPSVREKLLEQLRRSYEPRKGGFSDAPKFPQPSFLRFLLQAGEKTMVETTLREMAWGGIHDHIGQGICRYSTDGNWHVPHFEKMLYDQSQLIFVYSMATAKCEEFRETLLDLLQYSLRDLCRLGGFCSAEDADSYSSESDCKREGAFYVFTRAEILEVLGAEEGEIFCYCFGVADGGNVEPYGDPHGELKGKNVLYWAKGAGEAGGKFKMPKEKVESILKSCKSKLFEYRNGKRMRPALDTKIVASWNGLMVSGLCCAAVALKDPQYLDKAMETMEFIERHLVVKQQDEKLLDINRTVYIEDGKVSQLDRGPIPGCVDDFANVICGLIDLFCVSGSAKFLNRAIQLQRRQDDLFLDAENGGYFRSRASDASVILRLKDDDDGAEPSSNSVSLGNLRFLSKVAREEVAGDLKRSADKLLSSFAERLEKIPISLPLMTSQLMVESVQLIPARERSLDRVGVPPQSKVLVLESEWAQLKPLLNTQIAGKIEQSQFKSPDSISV